MNHFGRTAEDVLSWQNSHPQWSKVVPVMILPPVLTAAAETCLEQHVKINLNIKLFYIHTIVISYIFFFCYLRKLRAKYLQVAKTQLDLVQRMKC